MELIINHQKKHFTDPPSTLEELMHLEAPGKSRGIAVALNQVVIPRSEWAQTVINNNDNILIITATQGG